MNRIITLMLVLLCSISIFSRELVSGEYKYVTLTDNDEVVFTKKHHTEVVIGQKTIYINTFGLEHAYRILDTKTINSDKLGELIVFILNEECTLVLQARKPYSIALLLPDGVSYAFVNVD